MGKNTIACFRSPEFTQPYLSCGALQLRQCRYDFHKEDIKEVIEELAKYNVQSLVLYT